MSSGTVFVFGLNTWMTDKWTKTIMGCFLSHHICKVRIRLHCSILIIWLSLSLLPGAGREHRQQMKPSSELFFPFAIIFKAFTIFISWSLQILCLFVCWSVVLNHIKLIRSNHHATVLPVIIIIIIINNAVAQPIRDYSKWVNSSKMLK